MSANLRLACKRMGLSVGDVLDYAEYEDRIVFVMVQGHKHTVPLPLLTEPAPAAQQEPEPETEQFVDLESMPYRELQALAKDANIDARQSKAALIEALESGE